jgi:hypothetical protein
VPQRVSLLTENRRVRLPFPIDPGEAAYRFMSAAVGLVDCSFRI